MFIAIEGRIRVIVEHLQTRYVQMRHAISTKKIMYDVNRKPCLTTTLALARSERDACSNRSCRISIGLSVDAALDDVRLRRQ